MLQKNDLFDYGKYIYQDDNYFKFSLDSILLAEFIETKNNNHILDLCCGNAPIPLILKTKNSTLRIDAVEIQKEIFELAKKSVDESKFKDITVYNTDAKNYISKYKYDIVTCNPPYFKVTANSMLNDNAVKRIARHEVLITIDDIIITAKKNLKENGKLYIVHRTNRLVDVLDCLHKYKFGIRKICFIYTKDSQSAEFFLVESRLNSKDDPKVSSVFTKDKNTYKNIFKE